MNRPNIDTSLLTAVILHLIFVSLYITIGDNIPNFHTLTISYLLFYTINNEKLGITIAIWSIIQNSYFESVLHGNSMIDNIMYFLIPGTLSLILLVILIRYLTIIRENQKLMSQYMDLHNRMTVLSKLMPICSYCRKLRFEEKTWISVEDFLVKYIDDEMEFTHGICKQCENGVIDTMNLRKSDKF